ncbi:S8/S53 family peptidase [Mesorhizobium sp. M0050]|uniref:S8/S53 family peptidase n=1 Tax=Mesorhizobium sp. M0050 TaxID=2956861 RepID=UPI003338C4E8
MASEANGDFRNLYEAQALGCFGVFEEGQPFPFRGTIAELRLALRGYKDVECPKLIASKHVSEWTILALNNAALLSIPKLGQTETDLYRIIRIDIERIFQESNSVDTWSRFNEVATRIYGSQGTVSFGINMPVLSLGASLDINELAHTYRVTTIKGSPQLAGSVPWLSYIRHATPDDRALALVKSLPIDSVSDYGGGNPDSAGGSPDVAIDQALLDVQKKNLFAPINFDFELNHASLPRTIVIVDNDLNLNGCVFTGGCSPRIVDLSDLSNPSAATKDLYRKLSAELSDLKDDVGHGYGVAAIATARRSSGAMVGIDPQATPVLFQLNLHSWNTFQFKERAEVFANTLGAGAGLVVWNISGHTLDRQSARPISAYIRKFDQKRLPLDVPFFVIAAGNEAIQTVEDHGNECLSYPACWNGEYKNVITVVGAMIDENRVPQIWRDEEKGIMSYINPGFEIAAIAKNVLIPSNTQDVFYTEDGTSYAAPQVAGVVSQLRAQMLSPPEIVKARLVGCGRMSEGLWGKVLGGLLDVDCSLASNRTQVAFRPSAGASIDPAVAAKLRPGTLLGVWNDQNAPVSELTIKPKAGGSIAGSFTWWPQSNIPSIIGVRQFVDDVRQYKVAVWDANNKMLVDSRGELSDKQTLEIQFDGDAKPTCVPVDALISYVPAAPIYQNQQRDQIDASNSTCFGN